MEARELIAYGLLGALALSAVVAYAVARRRAYWRRLRMAGSSVAKQRELRR